WAEPSPVGADSPCLGEGLTDAMQGALSTAGWTPADVKRVYADLNGEEYRAHEWVLARCRTLSEVEVIHPADCIGDVGAASAPLLIGLASLTMHRGRAGVQKALVFCSSDFGTRGCACLASPTPPSNGPATWN